MPLLTRLSVKRIVMDKDQLESLLQRLTRQPNIDRESVLPLQGFHVGTIEKTILMTSKFGIDCTTDQLPYAIRYVTETISAYFKMSLYSEPRLFDAFVDCVFKGWKWYAGPSDTATLADRYKVWLDRASILADFEPYEEPKVGRRDFLGSIEMILHLMLRVSMIFITQNGLIGSMLKGCDAKEGDKLYVLLSGNALFIFIPFGKRQGYKLGCACFLHGYMQGEAIEAWEKGELELEGLIIV